MYIGPKRTRNQIKADIEAKALQNMGYLNELKKNPKEVLSKEFGTPLPEHVEVKVLEETENVLYIVLRLPSDQRFVGEPTEEPSFEIAEEELEQISGGVDRFSISTSFGFIEPPPEETGKPPY
jgi:hypothetical protein